MKVSELWLRSFINPLLSVAEIADELTNAGIEVDHLEVLEGTKQGILTLKVPANRGDCLSMEGIARELSVLNDMPFQPVSVLPLSPRISDTFPVRIEEGALCPRYLGCVIKNIKNNSVTPVWLKERVEAAGIRSVSIIVDIMNYVMLELGQPLHAFDLTKLDKEIVVRKSKPKEKITLLDNQEIILEPETLVIADKTKVQAIAGVMGGSYSSVTNQTTSLWIESAYFDPIAIRLTAKQVGLRTDASHRFERGIDPTLQKRALERAVQLVLEIAGGEVGPIVEQKSEAHLPKIPVIGLRRERIRRVLGIVIEDNVILNILQRLGMQVLIEGEGFKVSPPAFRGDITLEIDLIEEIIRVYGFHRLETQIPATTLTYFPMSEMRVCRQRFKKLLVDRGYYEVINYSFIDPKLAEIFDPNAKLLSLSNPISSDMAVMRASLWPGLLQAVQYNQRRQNNRTRFFEMGTCFLEYEGKVIEKQMLSGIAAGSLYKEQWGIPLRALDFYDIKNDVEALGALVGEKELTLEKAEHLSLHPGQTAKILRNREVIGYMGNLHPRIIKALELEGPVVVFEVEMAYLQDAKMREFHPISKFPVIRRDIAILVDKGIFAAELSSAIAECAGGSLQNVILFDVYQGKGIDPSKKSVALGLILQHPSRTLVEEEVNNVVKGVVTMLSNRFQAVLRE